LSAKQEFNEREDITLLLSVDKFFLVMPIFPNEREDITAAPPFGRWMSCAITTPCKICHHVCHAQWRLSVEEPRCRMPHHLTMITTVARFHDVLPRPDEDMTTMDATKKWHPCIF
jgi:hypothetical protein